LRLLAATHFNLVDYDSKDDHEATVMMKVEFMTCVISGVFVFVMPLTSHVHRSL